MPRTILFQFYFISGEMLNSSSVQDQSPDLPIDFQSDALGYGAIHIYSHHFKGWVQGRGVYPL